MKLKQLRRIILNSNGGHAPLDSAHRLLKKINSLENHTPHKFTQFHKCRDKRDFTGRIFEINFAYRFLQKNHILKWEVKQNNGGDIDFLWEDNGYSIYFELKLLGAAINQNDRETSDIFRLQRSILEKATLTKFSNEIKQKTINILALDITELYSCGIDLEDCMLAIGGNPMLAYFKKNSALMRYNVYGIYEYTDELWFSDDEWITTLYKEKLVSHPVDYIHAVIFFFRKPKGRGVLSYKLEQFIFPNFKLFSDGSENIYKKISEIFPKFR